MPRRTIEIIPMVKGDELYQKATPHPVDLPREPRPEWLKKKLPSDPNYFALKRLISPSAGQIAPPLFSCWAIFAPALAVSVM
jgi:hypothetical protein